VVDKPLIQYVVEECVASGIDNIIIVTGRGKNAIEDHFDSSPELESFLESKGKAELPKWCATSATWCTSATRGRKEPLGLGHAVLVAQGTGRQRAVRGAARRRDYSRAASGHEKLIEVYEDGQGGHRGRRSAARENRAVWHRRCRTRARRGANKRES
jgi:UTP-glucose-1-phosphate uridylyltransferase